MSLLVSIFNPATLYFQKKNMNQPDKRKKSKLKQDLEIILIILFVAQRKDFFGVSEPKLLMMKKINLNSLSSVNYQPSSKLSTF